MIICWTLNTPRHPPLLISNAPVEGRAFLVEKHCLRDSRPSPLPCKLFSSHFSFFLLSLFPLLIHSFLHSAVYIILLCPPFVPHRPPVPFFYLTILIIILVFPHLALSSLLHPRHISSAYTSLNAELYSSSASLLHSYFPPFVFHSIINQSTCSKYFSLRISVHSIILLSLLESPNHFFIFYFATFWLHYIRAPIKVWKIRW